MLKRHPSSRVSCSKNANQNAQPCTLKLDSQAAGAAGLTANKYRSHPSSEPGAHARGMAQAGRLGAPAGSKPTSAGPGHQSSGQLTGRHSAAVRSSARICRSYSGAGNSCRALAASTSTTPWPPPSAEAASSLASLALAASAASPSMPPPVTADDTAGQAGSSASAAGRAQSAKTCGWSAARPTQLQNSERPTASAPAGTAAAAAAVASPGKPRLCKLSAALSASSRPSPVKSRASKRSPMERASLASLPGARKRLRANSTRGHSAWQARMSSESSAATDDGDAALKTTAAPLRSAAALTARYSSPLRVAELPPVSTGDMTYITTPG
mmetsp:Transcript_41624/g.120549  ORF Transcript_41624/g.120549 Transcript_41624/m.120549 type:complete len:327 (-) Transcript_41624:863-1843(-)